MEIPNGKGRMIMIVVSSCLAGLLCRYDGGHCLVDKIEQLVKEKKAVKVCPEVMGGLSTPREPAEVIGGDGRDVLFGKAKVMTQSGKDVTAEYVAGAYRALERAKKVNASIIVLKEYSPSCGSQIIYDGTFSSEKIAGEGVTTALLKREGFNVISERQFLGLLEEEN